MMNCELDSIVFNGLSLDFTGKKMLIYLFSWWEVEKYLVR